MNDNNVWTWIRNGEKPTNFFKTEKSLLISYDLINLRGLDKCREVLNQKGRIVYGRLVESDGGIYVPFRGGQVDVTAADWGCVNDAYGKCLRSLCFYLSFGSGDPNKFGISDKENAKLRAFHWRSLSRDRRRRRPLARLKPEVETILFEYGWEVRSVTFVESDKLPNYYDVKVEGFKLTPYPDETLCEAFTFRAEGVKAPDAQTAVFDTICQQWQGCILEEADTGDGWIAYVGIDEDEPWLELEIDDYGDFATAVPYERRLMLAGVRPLEFVQ